MATALDDEIEHLRERVALLQKQLQVQTSTLLTSPATRALIHEDHRSAVIDVPQTVQEKLLEACDQHTAHKQQSVYRAAASITAFRVRDPDPNAVDGGRVLGLRIDTMMGAQFLRPYYVFLVRGDPAPPPQTATSSVPSGLPPLRVHRHTVPAAIPLSGLATRYLSRVGGATMCKVPDLYGFARGLRRALVRYHNRLAVIGDLRRAVHKTIAGNPGQSSNQLADVSGADAEAKQIRLDWADGRTGRLLVDDDGDIQQLVVIGISGARDRATARALLGGQVTATGLVQRMAGAR